MRFLAVSSKTPSAYPADSPDAHGAVRARARLAHPLRLRRVQDVARALAPSARRTCSCSTASSAWCTRCAGRHQDPGQDAAGWREALEQCWPATSPSAPRRRPGCSIKCEARRIRAWAAASTNSVALAREWRRLAAWRRGRDHHLAALFVVLLRPGRWPLVWALVGTTAWRRRLPRPDRRAAHKLSPRRRCTAPSGSCGPRTSCAAGLWSGDAVPQAHLADRGDHGADA